MRPCLIRNNPDPMMNNDTEARQPRQRLLNLLLDALTCLGHALLAVVLGIWLSWDVMVRGFSRARGILLKAGQPIKTRPPSASDLNPRGNEK